MTVTGMTCGGCEQAVTRALSQVQGVQDVAASHADSVVRVTYDAARVDASVLRARIEDLGYQVAD